MYSQLISENLYSICCSRRGHAGSIKVHIMMWVHVEVISSLGGWAILSNNEQQYVYSDRKTILKQKKIIYFYVFNDV